MSTKAKSSYQDPRYLQLWLVFEWPQPTDRVPVACAGCGWHGRRTRRSAAARPCPRCAGRVARSVGPVRDRSNVVNLADRTPATGRRVSGRRSPTARSARRG